MTNKIRWKTTLTDWFLGSGTEVVQSVVMEFKVVLSVSISLRYKI